jgi:hypothetical protein
VINIRVRDFWLSPDGLRQWFVVYNPKDYYNKLGQVEWDEVRRRPQYVFVPKADIVFDEEDLRRIADLCMWETEAAYSEFANHE